MIIDDVDGPRYRGIFHSTNGSNNGINTGNWDFFTRSDGIEFWFYQPNMVISKGMYPTVTVHENLFNPQKMATVANVLHILFQFPCSSLGNLGKNKICFVDEAYDAHGRKSGLFDR